MRLPQESKCDRAYSELENDAYDYLQKEELHHVKNPLSKQLQTFSKLLSNVIPLLLSSLFM